MAEKNQKSLNDTFREFQNWQFVLFILHFAAALSLGFYASLNDKDWKTKVYYKYNSWIGPKDADGCDKGCGIVELKDEVNDHEVSLAWASASFSIISGLHHLYVYLSEREWCYTLPYKNLLQRGVVWPRWIDYSFSSGIMFVIIGILFTSPPDLTFLCLLYSTQFLVIVAGIGSEMAWSCKRQTESFVLFILSLLGYVTPWIALFLTFDKAALARHVDTDYCGQNFPENYTVKPPPDFVWGAIIGLFITFSSFAIAHYFKIRKTVDDGTFFVYNLKYEIIYSFLSFTSKILLLANIGVGVVERENRNIQILSSNQTLTENEETTDATTFTLFLAIAGAISLVLGIVLFFRFKQTLFRKKEEDIQTETNKVISQSLVF